MPQKKIIREIMDYMVWVIEITARKYFGGDKGAACRELRRCGIWDI